MKNGTEKSQVNSLSKAIPFLTGVIEGKQDQSRTLSTTVAVCPEFHHVYRLDVAPLKKPGQRRGDIEFTAPRQTGHIGDRAPAIEEQDHPAIPARELGDKRGGELAGDHAEHGGYAVSSFL